MAAPNVNAPAPNVSYFTPWQNPPAGSAVFPQPDGKPVPKLFQPLKIRGVELQNRIFLSPLCQYSCKDGLVTPWVLAHLGGILSRGPGLTFVEASAVMANGRITPEDSGIWSDEHAAAFKPVVEFAHSQNQKIAIQLAHAGRKASCIAPFLDGAALAGKDLGGWPDDVWGPTSAPFHETYPTPKEATKAHIKELVKAFVDAAKRSVRVGFDVIEIHAAHGYMLSSFLSPTSNTRNDEYGGESFENRTRLLLEVVQAVRSAIPENTPLFVRISGTEWLEHLSPLPSWQTEDSVRLAPLLASLGVDLFDISAGGNDPRQKIRSGPQYQVGFASAIKASLPSDTKMLVSAVGGLHAAHDAYDVVENGKADVVFVGRQFQKNPGLVWQIAEELGVKIVIAKQIGWGFRGRGKQGLGWRQKDEEKKASEEKSKY